MLKNKHLLSYLFCLTVFLFSSIIELQAQVKWEVNELVKNGRIDAIADLGDGIVIAGSRWPNPGRIFRSIDYGITWEKIKTLKEPEGTYHNNEILCVMGGPDDYVYLLTSNAQFWRSADNGLTWKRTANLGALIGIPSYSYSICVTGRGTVLATRGYSIYRSTDNGLHFVQIGPITDNYLYRLQKVGNSIFVNGWAGKLYRSTDDGISWKSFAKIGKATYPIRIKKYYDPMKMQPYLTAIENIGDDFLLQGTMRGENYIFKPAYPDQIIKASRISGSLDDYVYLGFNTVLASTFFEENTAGRGKKNIYITFNKGESWHNTGPIPTGVKGDWLDHVTRLNRKDSIIAIGGTNKGFIARAAFSINELKRKSNFYNKK